MNPIPLPFATIPTPSEWMDSGGTLQLWNVMHSITSLGGEEDEFALVEFLLLTHGWVWTELETN